MKLSWKAEDVVRAVRGQSLHEQSWRASGVSMNTRTIQAGDLFFAIKGDIYDAHEFVAEAFAKGAAAAIVSKQPPQVATDAPLVFVNDVTTALEDLGIAGRLRTEARILAVTGSVGKTGSKEMLRLMLNATGATHANEGNLNSRLGVPLSLARLPAEARFGVFELGMNHAGEIGPLSKQVQPHVALITNVEAVHLEFFASTEAIAVAKAEIFEGMNADGAAVLNRDNPHFARLKDAAKTHGIKHILGFGADAKSDARLINCKATADSSEIEAEIMGRTLYYRLSAPGPHLVLNSLGALLAAIAAGAEADVCAAALAHYVPLKGRGGEQKIVIEGGEISLIDESYNASPPAVRAAIRVLGQAKPVGRRIMALGDMRELGKAAPELHAALAKDLIEAKIDRVHCCGEMMKHLHDALPATQRGFYAKDSTELAPRVASDLRAGDVITIKGSHSIHMELVIEAIKALDLSGKKKMAS